MKSTMMSVKQLSQPSMTPLETLVDDEPVHVPKELIHAQRLLLDPGELDYLLIV